MSGPVNRRAKLPGASELFRPTRPAADPVAPPEAEHPVPAASPRSAPSASEKPLEVPAPTGRVRHDQKITVYFSSEELFALEDATLALKRQGIPLDRGRLVRTAVALALADLAEHGDDSAVVAQLRSQ